MNRVRNLLSQLKPVHWVIALVIGIAILAPLTPHLLLFIIKHAAENQGYTLSYREADLSPFKGKLEYRDLEIHTGKQMLFGCGHCLVEIDISEAFGERYVVRQALISSARLVYTALPESQAQETGEIPYWQIDQLTISQLDLVGLPKLDGQTVRVQELTLDNLNRDTKKVIPLHCVFQGTMVDMYSMGMDFRRWWVFEGSDMLEIIKMIVSG